MLVRHTIHNNSVTLLRLKEGQRLFALILRYPQAVHIEVVQVRPTVPDQIAVLRVVDAGPNVCLAIVCLFDDTIWTDKPAAGCKRFAVVDFVVPFWCIYVRPLDVLVSLKHCGSCTRLVNSRIGT